MLPHLNPKTAGRPAGWPRLLLALLLLPLMPCIRAEERRELAVGVSKVDITPAYPIRLSGFGFRRAESEGVTHKIWAKAVAFGDAERGPAILIAADTLGVPAEITEEVARRLKAKVGLAPERLAITATHTHTAPMLADVAPTLFGEPIPPEHQGRIDQYTKEFINALERAALEAVADLRPARVSWGRGSVGFAVNRRTAGGPVDHDLPVLLVAEPDGKPRAVYFSYACHCVTLSDNNIGGDWAGFAQLDIEARHPGVVALASVGCGADSNPSSGVTGSKVEICHAQGAEIATEVDRLLKAGLTPLTSLPDAQITHLDLPLDTPRTRQEWEERATRQDAVGHHARVNVARLDKGEPLPTSLRYPVQTWSFGHELAMIFLPGETVVDYSLSLKRELDKRRLWVNGYANEGRCYIPSERILKEGGYEGGDAMIYYDRPQRFAPGLEAKILGAVHGQLKGQFNTGPGTEGIRPLSPSASLKAIRVAPGLAIDLVASEPLIADPVAVDWGADGRLWVCEMNDYPSGVDGNWKPGGRVKWLEDSDGDGQMDRATTFLEGIPFPTGIMPWGRGLYICAAPDILYAEDTDGDGRADKTRVAFTGFATDNYQARVNSLTLGLDNWIHAANGLLGGVIRSPGPGAPPGVDIRNHDFRFHPGSLVVETMPGLSQQGRTRDDWGEWFGCDNTQPLRHYSRAGVYSARNPAAEYSNPARRLPAGPDPTRVFPASTLLARFNDHDYANRFTSACGLAIFRGNALGDQYDGDAFTCEPVHNLVRREVIDRSGLTLASRKGPEEGEFLASSDHWFRPAQARQGPDGALYIVDMYRFLIEHPRWIPPERLAQIDIRAGAAMGRVYRVRSAAASPAKISDLTKRASSELAAALDDPSGPERDRVHAELLWRQDNSARSELLKQARSATLPQARAQALSIAAGLRPLEQAELLGPLGDPDPRVRAHALALAEPLLATQPPGGDSPLLRRVAAMAADPSPHVARQVAWTLGFSDHSLAGEALLRVAAANLGRGEIREAVLSSASHHASALLEGLLNLSTDSASRNAWVGPLLATLGARGDSDGFAKTAGRLLRGSENAAHAARLELGSLLLDALARANLTAAAQRGVEDQLKSLLPLAEAALADSASPEAGREAAVRLLGLEPGAARVGLLVAASALDAGEAVRVAARSLLRQSDPAAAAAEIIRQWPATPPGARAAHISLLVEREATSELLLGAVARGAISPREISTADRERLRRSGGKAVAERARELFAANTGGAASAELERLRPALALGGDAARGKTLFGALCASCHQLDSEGHPLGPDLAALASRDAAYWLQNIVDPSAAIEPRFAAYEIETKDERSLVGIILEESGNSLRVGMPNGLEEILQKSGIGALRALDQSLMPAGLAAELTPAQMADLLAFVARRPAAKSIPGNTPATITPEPDGTLRLTAAKASIMGGEITFEPQFQNIGMWHGQGDHAAWRVEVAKPGDYDIYLDYACAASPGQNVFNLTIADQTLTGKVAPTGSDWSNYRQIKIGTVTLPLGRVSCDLAPGAGLASALIDLRTILLCPAGATPRWPLAPAAPASAEVLRTPEAVARLILAPETSEALRVTSIEANPQFAPRLLELLAEGLEAGGPQEYQRIPWIWRVAIFAGRRGDPAHLRAILERGVPAIDQPLRDWQAVAIGGGIINGLSQMGVSPAGRIGELTKGNAGLEARWRRALELASAMAEDSRAPHGTRYDALRMLGVETFARRGAQLVKHLAPDAHAELQMGAVSALADIGGPEALGALLNSLPGLAEGNRELALDALEKSPALLAQALGGGPTRTLFSTQRLQRLREHPDAAIREAAQKSPAKE